VRRDVAAARRRWARLRGESYVVPEPEPSEDLNPVVVRVYKGSQRDVRYAFERDSPRWLARGYVIESQQYVKGRWG